MISAVAIISSFATMQFVDSVLAVIASVLTIATALLVLLQQRKLRRLGSLRREHNDLRRKANFFLYERERLHRTMDRMDQKVADLHYVPQEYHKLSKNKNVDRLTQIVQEQQDIHNAMRKKIRQRVMQQILGVVVKADRDQDWALGEQEIELLIVRLRLVEGIQFHEKRLREMLYNDSSIDSIFKLLRSIEKRDGEFQYEDPIFTIRPDKLLSTKTKHDNTGKDGASVPKGQFLRGED
jgi:hypothetical protein